MIAINFSICNQKLQKLIPRITRITGLHLLHVKLDIKILLLKGDDYDSGEAAISYGHQVKSCSISFFPLPTCTGGAHRSAKLRGNHLNASLNLGAVQYRRLLRLACLVYAKRDFFLHNMYLSNITK